MFLLLGSSGHTLDMKSIVLTKEFVCFYCNLLWTLETTSLRPLIKTPYRQFCTFCCLAILRPLIYKPNPSPVPWEWPRVRVLISEAWCCRCLGRLCRYGLSLSDCPTGVVSIYCYSDRHRICHKCGHDLVAELIVDHLVRWVCDCSPTVNNE